MSFQLEKHSPTSGRSTHLSNKQRVQLRAACCCWELAFTEAQTRVKWKIVQLFPTKALRTFLDIVPAEIVVTSMCHRIASGWNATLSARVRNMQVCDAYKWRHVITAPTRPCGVWKSYWSTCVLLLFFFFILSGFQCLHVSLSLTAAHYWQKKAII